MVCAISLMSDNTLYLCLALLLQAGTRPPSTVAPQTPRLSGPFSCFVWTNYQSGPLPHYIRVSDKTFLSRKYISLPVTGNNTAMANLVRQESLSASVCSNLPALQCYILYFHSTYNTIKVKNRDAPMYELNICLVDCYWSISK